MMVWRDMAHESTPWILECQLIDKQTFAAGYISMVQTLGPITPVYVGYIWDRTSRNFHQVCEHVDVNEAKSAVANDKRIAGNL